MISLSLFTPDLDLYDLNRVETLRGPQGTLFGSGSVGGTIRYITNQPNMTRVEGSLEANINVLDGGDIGGALTRHDQRARSPTASRCAPSAITPNMAASSTRSGPAARQQRQ